MGLGEEKNMTRRTHPANSQTSQKPSDLLTRLVRAGDADSLRPEIRTLRHSSSRSSLASFRYSPVPWSLFPVPCICDLNHGERKFPHFRGVLPSFQSTSS